MYAIIHTDISVAGNQKGDEHIGSREFIGKYPLDFLVKQAIIWNEGSPGGSSHKILELELAKSLTRNG